MSTYISTNFNVVQRRYLRKFKTINVVQRRDLRKNKPFSVVQCRYLRKFKTINVVQRRDLCKYNHLVLFSVDIYVNINQLV